MNVVVRPMRASDLKEADKILRLSFGTFMGLPDPMSFFGDTDYVKTRFYADPDLALVAEIDGKLIGSNFVTNWGTVGFFGPLSIHPHYWNKGIASKIMEPTISMLYNTNVKYSGLFTFAHSPKHVYLYQKYDFWPRYLTAIMSKKTAHDDSIKWNSVNDKNNNTKVSYTRFSQKPKDDHISLLQECSQITNSIYSGLDLQNEIHSVYNQKLGDTIIMYDDQPDNKKPTGIAICHYGPQTEAGSDTCYIKFGGVLPSKNTEEIFIKLLQSVETMAVENGISKITAGVNLERNDAYKDMLRYGFKTDLQGISMHKSNEQGYNRPDARIIDDWR